MLRKNIHVNEVSKDQNFEKKLEQIYRNNNVPPKERACTSTLYEMGRKAYFEEYFLGIDKSEQDFTDVENAIPVLNLEDFNTTEKIINTESFKRGYKQAEVLVRVDNIPEKYQYLTKQNKTR